MKITGPNPVTMLGTKMTDNNDKGVLIAVKGSKRLYYKLVKWRGYWLKMLGIKSIKEQK